MSQPDQGLVVHVNIVQNGEGLSESQIAEAVRTTARAEGVEKGEISVTLCPESEIAALNRTYLGREGPTDVIAFNLDEPTRPLGDVYICPEVARGHAAEHGVQAAEELLRLVVHGVLHVLGYDHPEGPERMQSEMFRRQEAILSQLAGLERES